MSERKIMPYPPEQDMRVGCKVSWLYYKDRADAEKASVAARANGVYYASQGYDFGYCAPGCIVFIDPDLPHYANSEHKGMYEVCIP